MAAQRIDGKAIAAKVREEVAAEAAAFAKTHGRAPHLVLLRVGDDEGSRIYVRNKREAAQKVGIRAEELHLPTDAGQGPLLALVERLNAERDVDGILVQQPLPEGYDERRVTDAVDPDKDVDGLHVLNAGRLATGMDGLRPPTAEGCLRLLREAGCDPAGKRAVVVGRSNLVGKPVAHLLLQAHATVMVCHSKTASLADEIGRAEIVVVAAGSPGLVRGEWIREGAFVIDVGLTRLADGKLSGDVDFEGASRRAAAITPVPGGVGPMTIAMLLSNAVKAARRRMQ